MRTHTHHQILYFVHTIVIRAVRVKNPSPHFACSLVTLTDGAVVGDEAGEDSSSTTISSTLLPDQVKNSSPHSAYSLTGQSDERAREMRRRILHPDSPNHDGMHKI
ncbi:hypothetical protein PRIPAC_87315 [Pristionchus pacificus]|uniref:Uncharacterized protein n=1 Tax=Pristionchus pacificus TaxID=54126 RepID=A0A2A6B6Z2_PRIPA|nr:hypothetical protein PRIPAC_87315 [Pristionchus pacificus]|eukprot:PDM61638.1 hypothetical protein PRIPAC_51080 [Pristionchus pacificus]